MAKSRRSSGILDSLMITLALMVKPVPQGAFLVINLRGRQRTRFYPAARQAHGIQEP